VLASSGKPAANDDDTLMRRVGFRSLDFSEVALRIEDRIGTELNFEASEMRRVATISDVIDFFAQATRDSQRV
jgi:acyl carrier protein